MQRIGILQVWQETNTFNPVRTSVADFEAFHMGCGPESLAEFAVSEEIGGFVSGLKAWRDPAEPIGLVMAQAWCSGSLTSEAREFFGDTIAEHLQRAGALDGILFSLHGALAAEDDGDVDGFLLEQVCRATGPEIPIVATVDLHACITPRMIEFADALVAYHSNPHIDRFHTGERAAALLERILHGARPCTSMRRVPMLTSGENTRTDGPVLAPVFQRVRELERDPRILSSGVLMAQPWVDAPETAWSVVVTADGAADLAAECAAELADMCWERREAMTFQLLDAAESVAAALACEGKPVVIADGADSTNSGACGDSVHLLRELIGAHIPDGALTFMVDPQAVAHARGVGVGARFEFGVGGKRDNVFSAPLPVIGEVLAVQPAEYILSGHLADHLQVNMGLSATVRIGNVTLLLVERSGPGSSPTLYRCVGLEPRDYKIVVVKSPAGFRADYEPFAAGIVLSACPGCASPRLTEMPYRKISRPLWPFDDIADWRDVE